jgi:flagellar biogenesis protein FliO
MNGRAVAAILLALGATSLTASAWADGDSVAETHPGSALDTPVPTSAPASTPLVLRPSKAVQLAPEGNLAGATWKIVAIFGALGATALLLRRRVGSKDVGDVNMTVVRRMAAGFRSELLIVNVEGQRLLIGVTPHTIQTLAVLDVDEGPEVELAGGARKTLGERFDAMLDSAAVPPMGGHPGDATSMRSKMSDESDDPSDQARGLLALKRRA